VPKGAAGSVRYGKQLPEVLGVASQARVDIAPAADLPHGHDGGLLHAEELAHEACAVRACSRCGRSRAELRGEGAIVIAIRIA
jgi:hypothetical protein